VIRRVLAALAVVVALAGCTSTITRGVTPHSTFGSGDDKAHATIYHCGVERWAVKTGTDAAAGQVNLGDVHQSTVAALAALPVPAGFSQDAPRLPPVETTVYQVKATLTAYKMEADSDYHLVLSQTATLADGSTRTYTMIAEIPLPGCVGQTSPFLPGITAARAAFDAQFPGAADGQFHQVQVPVTVTGVGFFDTKHGQTGVAPNGFEEHPVDAITFGPSPSG
jgi:hypothetical protein